MQTEAHIPALYQGGNKALNEVTGHGRQHANSELLNFGCDATFYQCLQLFATLEDIPCVCKYSLTLIGQDQSAPLPFEQPGVHIVFQRADLGGQRGLRHVELTRRFSQVAQRGNSPEVIQVVIIQTAHRGQFSVGGQWTGCLRS